MTNATTDQTICPPRHLTEILIQKARDLQMLPDVAIKAISVADDPDAKIKELTSIIAQDIKLTTNLLSLSNSTLFGVGQPVSSLQIAITRVGFRQTKNMILASCFTSMLNKMDWKEVRIRDLLCNHSFLTGIISSRLNKLFNLGLQGEEFTAGLTHDVGRTLLAVTIPDEFSSLDSLEFSEDETILSHELNRIGTTHAEVGAWFLQRNHLPEELVSVARYHHNPQDAAAYKRLIALVGVADDLANFQQRQDGSEHDCSELASLQLLESLGVEKAVAKLSEHGSTLLESAVEEVSQLTSM